MEREPPINELQQVTLRSSYLLMTHLLLAVALPFPKLIVKTVIAVDGKDQPVPIFKGVQLALGKCGIHQRHFM
jgi:hypothetical protein